MDSQSSETQWFLDNCSIVDPLTQATIPARAVNFNTEKGKTLMNSNWQCSSGDSTWDFNFDTCQWTTISGTKTLIQVRDSHNRIQGRYAQTFLGM